MTLKGLLRGAGYALASLVIAGGAAGKASANAIITTEVPKYISPGQDYVMQITADNKGLSGEKTRSIDWSFFNIPSYVNVTEVRLPILNDFFEGFSMNNTLQDSENLSLISGRTGLSQDGPANMPVPGNVAVVAEYVFNINGYSGSYDVQGKFDLKGLNTKFHPIDPSDPLQLRTISEHYFTIIPPGDFDADGTVDGVDFGLWQAGYPTASGAILGNGDADLDGDIDGADFGIWQANYPTNVGGGVVSGSGVVSGGVVSDYTNSIPEPTTLGLSTLALATLIAGAGRGIRKKSLSDKL